jgi:hypothetical protein
LADTSNRIKREVVVTLGLSPNIILGRDAPILTSEVIMRVSPQIRIDDEVYELLKRKAEPFVDTPNSVLRRELGLGKVVQETSDSSRQKGSHGVLEARRARAGELIPIDAYFDPILASLSRHGGSARVGTVLEEVGQQLSDELTYLDRSNLPTGGKRWRNRVQWARQDLVGKGLLEAGSPHGTWTISAKGREHLEAHGR